LLDAKKIPYRYREYTEAPLTKSELTKVVRMLGVKAATLLRKNDPAYKDRGLTGSESDAAVIELMVAHPTLLQRPIGILGNRAVVGRPPEALLDLAT
jgi:arsenate reductase (glutaredoxin)